MIWVLGAYLGILGHRKRLAVERGGRKKEGGRKGEGGGGGGKEWFRSAAGFFPPVRSPLSAVSVMTRNGQPQSAFTLLPRRSLAGDRIQISLVTNIPGPTLELWVPLERASSSVNKPVACTRRNQASSRGRRSLTGRLVLLCWITGRVQIIFTRDIRGDHRGTARARTSGPIVGQQPCRLRQRIGRRWAWNFLNRSGHFLRGSDLGGPQRSELTIELRLIRRPNLRKTLIIIIIIIIDAGLVRGRIQPAYDPIKDGARERGDQRGVSVTEAGAKRYLGVDLGPASARGGEEGGYQRAVMNSSSSSSMGGEARHDDDSGLTEFLSSLMDYTPTVKQSDPRQSIPDAS